MLHSSRDRRLEHVVGYSSEDDYDPAPEKVSHLAGNDINYQADGNAGESQRKRPETSTASPPTMQTIFAASKLICIIARFINHLLTLFAPITNLDPSVVLT